MIVLKSKHSSSILGDDFLDDCDLLVAAIVLQKQIEYIDGKKENIITPNVAMKKIREQAVSSSTIVDSSSITDAEMSTSSIESDTVSSTNAEPPAKNPATATMDTTLQHPIDDPSPSNPCVLCFTEEKRLACIPCGHFATCVACGHSLRSCPICRREIEAFVRIYL